MTKIQNSSGDDESQLVSTFSNPLLNMTLLRIKEQFDKWKNPNDIRIEHGLAEKVIEAYEQERIQAEADLDALAVSIARDYWGINSDSELNISLCADGRCTNPEHSNLVHYERTLNQKLLHMLRGDDYELTERYAKKCQVKKCTKKIEPLISYIEYLPKDKSLESIVHRISVRTKGDDRLAAKIADGVCDINSKVRPGSIHPRWDPRDFRGCQIVLENQAACYTLLHYLQNRKDIQLAGPKERAIDDYFANPKMIDTSSGTKENPYKAIHVHIIYMGVPIELQLVPQSVINSKEVQRGVASHGYFAERQDEARRQDPLWNDVFQRVSDILNPKAKIRRLVSYR